GIYRSSRFSQREQSRFLFLFLLLFLRLLFFFCFFLFLLSFLLLPVLVVAMSKSVRLELKFGSSNKFWECVLGPGGTKATKATVRFGRIGGHVLSQVKLHPNTAAA
ncbi:unnamed protein product, partial [Polarella glacialis]